MKIILRRCCHTEDGKRCDKIVGCYMDTLSKDCDSCPYDGDCLLQLVEDGASHTLCTPHLKKKHE